MRRTLRAARRVLRTIGRALLVGLTGAGIAAGGRRWYGSRTAEQPAGPLRDEPPPAHPDKVVPLKSLPWPEVRWWHELERRLE